jgi:endonuclease I
LRAVWEDPTDPAKIILIYGGAPALKTALTWNREHLWPRSRGVNPSTAPDGGPDDSDLFHVVPADGNVNSARSNLYFDMSRVEDGGFKDPAHIEAPLCTRDANSWQPPVAQRGEIARAMFYMAVRYDGNEPGTADLELLTSAPTDASRSSTATRALRHPAPPPRSRYLPLLSPNGTHHTRPPRYAAKS